MTSIYKALVSIAGIMAIMFYLIGGIIYFLNDGRSDYFFYSIMLFFLIVIFPAIIIFTILKKIKNEPLENRIKNMLELIALLAVLFVIFGFLLGHFIGIMSAFTLGVNICIFLYGALKNNLYCVLFPSLTTFYEVFHFTVDLNDKYSNFFYIPYILPGLEFVFVGLMLVFLFVTMPAIIIFFIHKIIWNMTCYFYPQFKGKYERMSELVCTFIFLIILIIFQKHFNFSHF